MQGGSVIVACCRRWPHLMKSCTRWRRQTSARRNRRRGLTNGWSRDSERCQTFSDASWWALIDCAVGGLFNSLHVAETSKRGAIFCMLNCGAQSRWEQAKCLSPSMAATMNSLRKAFTPTKTPRDKNYFQKAGHAA